MPHWSVRVLPLIIGVSLPGTRVFAQAAAPAPAVEWTVAAGYAAVALRDVARTTPPVDASPVSWQGHGPTVAVRYRRVDGSRLHRLQIEAALAGNFVYRFPERSAALSDAEAFGMVDGRYEFRRALFANRGVRGLHIDLGVQGIAALSTLTHETAARLTMRERILATGPAVVAGVRLRRWSAVACEVDWINGMLVARFREIHAGAGFPRAWWGGGWLEDLSGTATIRVTTRTALAVRYLASGGGRISDHHNVATAQRSFAFGVVYVK
jgi:hypothetical protein